MALVTRGKQLNFLRLFQCLFMAIALGAPAFAAESDVTATLDAAAPIEPSREWNEKRYYDLLAELRCLVCQNQSLADSDASLAGDLRDQVKRMMLAGADNQQIKAFMTERYGDFVLYDPPLKPRTYILWAAPFLILAAMLFLLMRTVIKRSKGGAT